jgi:hypothetical protein
MIQGIGSDVLEKMKQLGDELISAHIEKIKSAYNHSDDQKLAVSLSFSLLAGEKPGDYDVEASITYIVERIKDKIKATVSATAELFPEEESKPYILNNKQQKEEGE